jgi:hypothetical protein
MNTSPTPGTSHDPHSRLGKCQLDVSLTLTAVDRFMVTSLHPLVRAIPLGDSVVLVAISRRGDASPHLCRNQCSSIRSMRSRVRRSSSRERVHDSDRSAFCINFAITIGVLTGNLGCERDLKD